MHELKWTGERLVTSLEGDFLVYEHLHRYAFAQKLCTNKIVLDIACGEGYGTYLLSKVAEYVYGVDIDETTILHGTEKYKKQANNISFKTGSTSDIPLDEKSVDAVVSFETIEHHDRHEEMMREIKRVLKEDGMLIISSPNKEVYSQRSTNNPFHTKELGFDEFKYLMGAYFKDCLYFKQSKIAASLIVPVEQKTTSFYTFDGDYTTIEENMRENGTFNKGYFSLAVCSNALPGNLQIASIFNADKGINNMVEKSRNQVLKSTSFKIGNAIVSRLHFLKGLLPKKIIKQLFP